jgi:hypothetical protein
LGQIEDMNDLSEIYSLFVYGISAGAFLSGIVWVVAFAVDFLTKLFKSSV